MNEKEFIQNSIKKQKAKNYIKESLDRAGIVEIDIRKTTLGNRILIIAEKPGLVIGKKGTTIDRIKNELEEDLGLEDVEIDVDEVENRNLHPDLACNWAKALLKKGLRPNKIAKKIINGVMDAGAMGAQITITGVTLGANARSVQEKKSAGYLKKAGQETKKIRKARKGVILPQGKIGVEIRIAPPGVKFLDKTKPADYIKEEKEDEDGD